MRREDNEIGSRSIKDEYCTDLLRNEFLSDDHRKWRRDPLQLSADFAISYGSLVDIETVNGCTRMTDMNPLLTVRITSSTVFAPLITAMEASSTAARHAR